MLKNWNYYKQIRAAKNNKQDTLDFIDLVRKYGKEPLLKEIDKFEAYIMYASFFIIFCV